MNFINMLQTVDFTTLYPEIFLGVMAFIMLLMGFVNISFGVGIMETGAYAIQELTGGIYQILAHGLIIALLFATLFIIGPIKSSLSSPDMV